MPRKFRHYVPKGASRKKSTSSTPVSFNTPASSCESDEESTCTIGTQCELMESPLTTTQDEAVQATVETFDVSTQTDDLVGTDELQDDSQE